MRGTATFHKTHETPPDWGLEQAIYKVDPPYAGCCYLLVSTLRDWPYSYKETAVFSSDSDTFLGAGALETFPGVQDHQSALARLGYDIEPTPTDNISESSR